MKTKEIKELEQQIHDLEKKLAESYQLLGKRTQEFTLKESKEINYLVDEIIIAKQKMIQLKNTIVTD